MAKIKDLNFKTTTVVGNKVALMLIALAYACGIVPAVYFGRLDLMLIVPVIHLAMDIVLVMNKSISTMISLARFLNESAMAIIVGWLLMMVWLFGWAIFGSDESRQQGDKLFGVAFGAGVGLLIVCAPCFLVASLCTAYLVSANAPPTPFFGDE